MANSDSGWFGDAFDQLAPFADGRQPAGGGGGWELSEEKLKSLIPLLDDIADEIATAHAKARPLVGIEPPGKDPHSERVVAVMNESGQAYLDSLLSQGRYVDAMRRAMQKSLDSYRGVERDNTDMARTVSHNLEGGI